MDLKDLPPPPPRPGLPPNPPPESKEDAVQLIEQTIQQTLAGEEATICFRNVPNMLEPYVGGIQGYVQERINLTLEERQYDARLDKLEDKLEQILALLTRKQS